MIFIISILIVVILLVLFRVKAISNELENILSTTNKSLLNLVQVYELGNIEIDIVYLDEEGNVLEQVPDERRLRTARVGDGGIDLKSRVNMSIAPGERGLVPLGIKTLMPKNVRANLRGRSGMDSKGYNVRLGLIDSGYTGEWMANIKNNSDQPLHIGVGDRVAQVTFERFSPVEFNLKLSLDDTERGQQGFGSTGK